ncbi:hypothetical protein [Kutzneria kofuensis]|uniref:hypothetical protein n=1 Tax=Kutzneria kofuensis TaxID=103725 RepID=UPI0031EACAF2
MPVLCRDPSTLTTASTAISTWAMARATSPTRATPANTCPNWTKAMLCTATIP